MVLGDCLPWCSATVHGPHGAEPGWGIDILANWNLSQDKLVFTTTDNGSNFISAFDLLELPRLSRFGHNLDLVINKALQVNRVQQAIGRCYTLVGRFSRSWKKNRDLRQKQLELWLPEHRLISDVTTRWGSTYSMIARILEQQQAICAVLADDWKHWHLMPSDREFVTLEIVSQVIQPLSVFTVHCSLMFCPGKPKLLYRQSIHFSSTSQPVSCQC